MTAECVGSFWVVLVGCGCQALATDASSASLGLLGLSLAFGLSVTTATFLFQPISGAHFNPAVTVGFAIANRFPVRDLVPYIVAQVAGAVAGAALVLLVASGRPGFDIGNSAFGANGYGLHSPMGYRVPAVFVIEAVMTFAFVSVHLAMAENRAYRAVGPLVIGLTLTLIGIVAMPVSGASGNPARSTGPAVLVGGWALDQLWLFWAAPLSAGLLAGLCFPAFANPRASVSARNPGSAEGDSPLR
jgi:aquaporin Z